MNTSTSDAVIQLLAIKSYGKENGVATRRAQIEFLNKFPFDQQAEIILGVCLADKDYALAIVQQFRDAVAERKAGKADPLSGR